MMKILIVEDELAYVKLLKENLLEKGYEVLEAKNEKEGLAMAKKEKPDLILLDIKMPVVDGMTMLGLLRQDENIKDTKVIILTNLEPDDKIIGEVVKDQPTYYFIKSNIKLEDLMEKIHTVLSE